ncbi:MAG: metallophosphoesterase [Oscillospiraceae bacterium]|nr:metallophosphoesterase [Oscillospiraceae bacterium]
MRIFAIGDLHLSLSSDKPMDVFGSNWDNHSQRVAQAWKDAVEPNDLVLIPGDISWAMQLKDAEADIRFIGDLPGRKVIMRGNHDYWWNSVSKVRSILPKDMWALQNDAVELENVVIAGSRGWMCPGSVNFHEAEDQKIYDREVSRLGLSLSSMPKNGLRIVMMHYPPFNERRQPSGFTELFEKYGVKTVVYGHLHGKSCRNAFEGERNGVEYILCSADHLEFNPKLIAEI